MKNHLTAICALAAPFAFAVNPGAPALARYEAESARLAGGAALKGPSIVQSDIAAQALDTKYVELGKRGATGSAFELAFAKVSDSGVYKVLAIGPNGAMIEGGSHHENQR